MPKWYSKEEALAKLQHFCAYQDRCHQEVRQKLMDMGVYPDWREEIITELIQDNFLNEERFAQSFARGKFRMKQWGRQRIARELKQRQISDYCIKKGMAEISEPDYQQALRELLEKKDRQLQESDPWARKAKLVRYALSKGFESQLTWPAVHQLVDSGAEGNS
ncbi:regulatory protein RecX [Phaeodactylibacter luteus]|uniref:Regulatory protein RecX n=1 Tax=Phaeodactylibacter luteus TaxID=1564516 RepID=A0A5C6RLB1_9BACT|nr:regulatory protein RecX [Phaeodactylibacter luteus]TXB63158.1 RecX family transcriptional regulator [Phaeodactylibacter luteus]